MQNNQGSEWAILDQAIFNLSLKLVPSSQEYEKCLYPTI